MGKERGTLKSHNKVQQEDSICSEHIGEEEENNIANEISPLGQKQLKGKRVKREESGA